MTKINAKSILFNVDSYKSGMWRMYPPGTTNVYSYVAPRKKGECVLNFGLQAFLKDVMTQQITKEEVLLAEKFWTAHGEPFNTEGWLYIVEQHNGYLPLEIRGLDEGFYYPTNVPVATVVNTDEKCFWLTTWIETAMLRTIWFGSTVATKSNQIRKVIQKYLEISGDPTEIAFKNHDFSFRGVSSLESAKIGGAAHLLSFMGTDTVAGIFGAAEWYDADPFTTAFSVPASEHSVITAWGRDGESLAYENMIKQFSKEGSIYACVSDSYNIFNAVENIWGKELCDKIIESKGTLVIRPDSLDPIEVLPRLISSLGENFGYTVNDKGYKVLNNVRLLWGDGIDINAIRSILRVLVDIGGWSANNIAFGMGGKLTQVVNRDDHSYAMKASAVKINGEWKDIFKDPVGDQSKKSLTGRFVVHVDYSVSNMVNAWPNMLKLRYRNGQLFNTTTFDEVRARVNS